MAWLSRSSIAATALCAALAAVAAPSSAEFVDRIIAAVNNEVITASDLRQATVFNEAVSGAPRDREQAAAETLEGLINRRLLVQEARRFGFAWPAEQDVRAELETVKKRLGPDHAFAEVLSRAGMTEAQLSRMLGERIFVERFLEKRIGVFVRVGRDEAQAYFREHAAEFPGKRFSEAYRDIIALLSERKKEKQIEQYLAGIRSKADIRVNP